METLYSVWSERSMFEGCSLRGHALCGPPPCKFVKAVGYLASIAARRAARAAASAQRRPATLACHPQAATRTTNHQADKIFHFRNLHYFVGVGLGSFTQRTVKPYARPLLPNEDTLVAPKLKFPASAKSLLREALLQ